VSCRKYAYDVEYAQGKHILNAAAKTVETLDANGFLVSTLSHAGKCSNGMFQEPYHFDAKADMFPVYVSERYSELAGKMGCVQTARSWYCCVSARASLVITHSRLSQAIS